MLSGNNDFKSNDKDFPEMEELTLDIYIISRLTHIFYTGELRKLGITMGQFPFIMRILDHQGVSQEKLSGMLRISKSTTAVMIGQLVKAGIVHRTVDAADRRNFHLFLTGKGIALIPRIEKVIRRCHELMTSDFSAGEKKILEELLRRARNQAEKKLINPLK